MSLVLQIILSVFLCVLIFVLIYTAKSKAFLPIRSGEDIKISAVVFARGSAECLQQVADGFAFLRSAGKTHMDVIIADSGLNREARKMAEILIKNREEIKLCRAEDLYAVLGDGEWMNREKPYN